MRKCMGLVMASVGMSVAMVGAAASVDAADDADVRVQVMRSGGTYLVVSAPAGASADPQTAALLQARISCDFVDADLADVVGFLRQHSGANFVIDPDVVGSVPPISLTVTDMSAERVLAWAMRLTDLEASYVNEAVWISDEPYRGARVTRMYDVTDLGMPIRDFEGPSLSIPQGAEGVQMIPPFADADDEHGSWEAEQIAEMIEDHFNDR